jgi:hypothetical protein
MLLIEEVFEDMTNCLGQYQKISLPSREFIETARRKLEDSGSFETKDLSVIFKPAEAAQGPRGKIIKIEQPDKSEHEQANKEPELEGLSRESLRHRGKAPEVPKWSEWSAWAWDGEGHRWCRTRTNSEGESYNKFLFVWEQKIRGSKDANIKQQKRGKRLRLQLYSGRPWNWFQATPIPSTAEAGNYAESALAFQGPVLCFDR